MTGKRYTKYKGFLLFSFIFVCLFSFSVFADAYKGGYVEYDETGTAEYINWNPSGETFSGQNEIEGSVSTNQNPDLYSNTFNGSVNIDTNSFNSLTSTGNTYNNTTIDVVPGAGTIDSNNDTFRSSTTLAASQSDVEINNAEFNGSLSINANTVSLGSVPEMSQLITDTQNISYFLSMIIWNFGVSYVSTSNQTYTHQTVNGTYVQSLIPTFEWTITYSDAGAVFTPTQVYCNLGGLLKTKFDNISYLLRYGFEFLIHARQYPMWNFTGDGEFYNITQQTYTTSFFQMVENRLSIMCSLLSWYCNRFFNWYYPLDNVIPMYWQYYNTDTQQSESIGLAGLMYNISWYLGQMYVLQVASSALDDVGVAVEDLSDELTSFEASENSVISSVSSGIESFIPNVSDFGAFTALSWCSQYLQRVFVALGLYGNVIMIGLLLGVCMQFIGYFRYK